MSRPSIKVRVDKFLKVDSRAFHTAQGLCRIFTLLNVEVWHPPVCNYWQYKVTPNRKDMIALMWTKEEENKDVECK